VCIRKAYVVPLPDGRELRLGERPLVMGIVNVTPDSFADESPTVDSTTIIDRAIKMQEEGADLLTAYKRAANILKKEKWEGTGASGGSDLEPPENTLSAALDTSEPKASAAVEKEDFTGAMGALATLRRPIDDFFDHVTVNDPDAAKRERRLNLLMRFRDAVNRVADFSKIEG